MTNITLTTLHDVNVQTVLHVSECVHHDHVHTVGSAGGSPSEMTGGYLARVGDKGLMLVECDTCFPATNGLFLR